MRAAVLHILAVVVLVAGCSRVHETTLGNGLKVIVKEDHRAPVVVSQLWYRVGSADEPAGLTGISHVLEHMMFKGTAAHGPGEFSRIIAENGGRENAFTSYDYTAYFQQLERSRLATALELEADRMTNLTLDPAEFAREVKVVMEERRLRTEDQPQARTYERFMAAAFPAGPYGHPVIGSMADLRQLTDAQLRAWYRRWYAPNDAALVVVGDVRPAAVFELANRYFGAIPARVLTRAPRPVEPPQQALRRIRVALPAEVPYLIMGYHVPSLATAGPQWEPYALDVVAAVLDGGNSARFPRDLIRDQGLAASVNVDYDPVARDATLLTIAGVPAAGQTSGRLEQAIRQEIERLRTTPVAEAELGRVKAQVIARDVYHRDSMFYQAMEIGSLVSVGLDWRLAGGYVDRIKAVTAGQVQAVARKYLVDRNLTIATLEPLPMSRPRGRPRSPAEIGHVR